jgi:hypothetical protein
VKQLGLELVDSLAIGLTIAFVSRVPQKGSADHAKQIERPSED